MIPFTARNLLERALIYSGLNEPQARQAAFAGPGGFDLTRWPRKHKAYAKPRPAPPRYITVHVTDVLGGFGVSKAAVKRWGAYLYDHAGALPDYLPEFPLDPMADVMATARRLALWERLKDQAYHQIGAANGDSLAVRGIESWSWHAGKWANTNSAGFAADVHHAQDLDTFTIQTNQAALRALYWRVVAYWEVETGEPAPVIKVIPHRATDKNRRVDPQGNAAEGVWTNVVLPVIDAEPGLEADYNFKTASGLWIPKPWDPNALYDWRGRKL
jgi:hypothetical protein